MYKENKVIALCISKISIHTEFIRALNNVLQNNGYKLFVYHTCSDLFWNNQTEKAEKAVFDLIDYNIVDAVIVHEEAFFDKETVKKIISRADENKKPVIIIGADDGKHISMYFDHEKGFEVIVRHVIEYHNIKNVHFIAGVKGEYHSDERIRVFKKVLCDNGIAFSDDMLSYGDYWHMPTKEAVDRLLKRGTLPQAIICANDSMAITVCEELEMNNIRVPEDIIVTGFDGIKDVEYCSPSITTCKYDSTLFVEKLYSLAEKMLSGSENMPVQRYAIDFSPIMNQSCGCNKERKRKNMGLMLKYSEDIFNSYCEHERTYHELLENCVMCDTTDDITEGLRKADIGRTIITLNKSCFDSSINPLKEQREQSFDERMVVAYSSIELMKLPYECSLYEITPVLANFMDYTNPLVFTALGFMGVPFGYVVQNYDANDEEYSRIPQCINAINTLIGCNRNVRYIKYASDQIEKMSMQDYLTESYNRSGFYSNLSSVVSTAAHSGRKLAVVSIDADGLKYVNDNFGHINGDFVIRTASKALQNISFEDKICGRFGGDELAACVVIDDTESAEAVIKSDIKRYLDDVNSNSGKPFEVSVSVGVYICGADGFDFDEAYKSADVLMYKDKEPKARSRRR